MIILDGYATSVNVSEVNVYANLTFTSGPFSK
jgi:hypothetical protein